jgi:hypothetical protein
VQIDGRSLNPGERQNCIQNADTVCVHCHVPSRANRSTSECQWIVLSSTPAAIAEASLPLL